MHIPFDRRHDDRSFVRLLLCGQKFLDFLEGSAHCFGRQKNLRQKDASCSKVDADVVHGGRQSLLCDFIRRMTFAYRPFGQHGDAFRSAVDDRLLDGSENIAFYRFGLGCLLWRLEVHFVAAEVDAARIFS